MKNPQPNSEQLRESLINLAKEQHAKTTKYRKERMSKIGKRILPQIIIQSLLVILTALLSFSFMTWLVTDIFRETRPYLALAFESLGTLVMLILLLVPLNTMVYRRRVRELSILCDAIQKVAAGDYASKIPSDQKGQISPIYEDFNKMCDELESIQILRNDFLNNYSHEFKTPIASINGFAELLLTKQVTPEEQKLYLEIIADESARLSHLATNTILLSRLSSQQIVTDAERYDISEQLRQCSIILSRKWLEKGIDFDVKLTPITYYGNKEMMQHLWLNLIDNAIKYTPAGGKIRIYTELSHNQAIISIVDTGEGIPEYAIRNLFNPYYQVDPSHSRQGLGLGLSIARRIVELCGGNITVSSKPGAGSTFSVSLPVFE